MNTHKTTAYTILNEQYALLVNWQNQYQELISSESSLFLYNNLKELYKKIRQEMKKIIQSHNQMDLRDYKMHAFDLFLKMNQEAKKINFTLEKIADEITQQELAKPRSEQSIDMMDFTEFQLQTIEHNIYEINFYGLDEQSEEELENFFIDIKLFDSIRYLSFGIDEQLAERKDVEAIKLLARIHFINENYTNKKQQLIKSVHTNFVPIAYQVEDKEELYRHSNFQIAFLDELLQDKILTNNLVTKRKSNHLEITSNTASISNNNNINATTASKKTCLNNTASISKNNIFTEEKLYNTSFTPNQNFDSEASTQPMPVDDTHKNSF